MSDRKLNNKKNKTKALNLQDLELLAIAKKSPRGGISWIKIPQVMLKANNKSFNFPSPLRGIGKFFNTKL